MKKILAFSLVVLLAVAAFAPAFAADKVNVMLTSEHYDFVNITPDKGSYDELKDGLIATGPTHIQGGCNLRIAAADIYNLYDVEGEENDEGSYIGFIVYELDAVYTVDSFKMYVLDMAPLGIGVSNTIDWLPRCFDILVSTTAEEGSWNLVYSGKDLHGEGDDAGAWELLEENDESLARYCLAANFDKAAEAKYIKLAFTDFNNTGDPTAAGARFFNISEWEVYGVAAGNAPATEDTTPVTEDTTPVTEDTTPATEDTTPATEDTTPVAEDTTPVTEDTTATEDTEAPETFDFVIVPVVALAAAAAGAVVLKKKEN